MDKAAFISFHSSHDLDQVTSGEKFIITWRVRNTGDTTWGSGYKLVHIHESTGSTLMTSKRRYDFSEVASRSSVAPGQEVNLTLTMTAPQPRAKLYFTDWQLQGANGRFFGDVLWLRVVTVAPPPPDPTGFLSSDLKYIEDTTIPDGTPLEEGTTFVKQWLVRNSGQRKWNSAYRLVFVSGDTQLTGVFSHTVPEADPGEEVILSINMTAPPARDEPYISSWRLHDDRNIPFGENLWIKMFATVKTDGFGVTPYSQNDPRWKNKTLGFGTRTFSEFGCLVTCFSMMLSRYGENADPLTLNNRFKAMNQNGFSGSDIFFIAPAWLIDHVKYWGNYTGDRFSTIPHTVYRSDLIAEIDAYLARGDGVMFQVDSEPADPYHFDAEQHWVLALARQGNDYLIMDPIDGRPASLLAKYGLQTKPQSANEALLGAIKSALLYRSTHATPPGTVDDDGKTDIGGETLAYTGPAWPFGKMLPGVHDRATRHPEAADHAIVRGKFDAVKVMSGITVPEMTGYQAQFYLCRLFESWNGRHVPVTDFVNTVSNDIARLVQVGVEYFEFHNEPNLTHEGLIHNNSKGSWRNGAEFANYFIEGRRLLRQRFPGIKVGFPGLSPGGATSYTFGHDSGFRMDSTEFFSGAQAALRAADFIGVHAYYQNMAEARSEAIEQVRAVRRAWPDKLIFVTEYSNPSPNATAVEKGRQAKEFMRLCSRVPGVGATFYFVVSGPGWHNQALRLDSNGRSTGMIEEMF